MNTPTGVVIVVVGDMYKFRTYGTDRLHVHYAKKLVSVVVVQWKLYLADVNIYCGLRYHEYSVVFCGSVSGKCECVLWASVPRIHCCVLLLICVWLSRGRFQWWTAYTAGSDLLSIEWNLLHVDGCRLLLVFVIKRYHKVIIAVSRIDVFQYILDKCRFVQADRSWGVRIKSKNRSEFITFPCSEQAFLYCMGRSGLADLLSCRIYTGVANYNFYLQYLVSRL